MSCFSSSRPVQRRLIGLSTSTEQYEWFTEWTPAIGLDYVKGVWKPRSVQGSIESRLALQTADVRTDKPDSPVLLGSVYQAGAGEWCGGTMNIASNLAGKFFARFGVAHRLTSGSIGQSDTTAEFAWDACGRVLGSRSLQLQVQDTGSLYEPLSAWFPAIHADKVKAALVQSNCSTYFRTQLAVRTATTSQQSTNAWSNALESSNWHVGDGEYNTGEVSLSTSNDMWMQIGLQYNVSQGTNGYGHVDVAVAVRRS